MTATFRSMPTQPVPILDPSQLNHPFLPELPELELPRFRTRAGTRHSAQARIREKLPMLQANSDAIREFYGSMEELEMVPGMDELEFVDRAKVEAMSQVTVGLTSNAECPELWSCGDSDAWNRECRAISDSDNMEFDCTQFTGQIYNSAGELTRDLSCACQATCYALWKEYGRYWSEHYVPPAICDGGTSQGDDVSKSRSNSQAAQLSNNANVAVKAGAVRTQKSVTKMNGTGVQREETEVLDAKSGGVSVTNNSGMPSTSGLPLFLSLFVWTMLP